MRLPFPHTTSPRSRVWQEYLRVDVGADRVDDVRDHLALAFHVDDCGGGAVDSEWIGDGRGERWCNPISTGITATLPSQPPPPSLPHYHNHPQQLPHLKNKATT